MIDFFKIIFCLGLLLNLKCIFACACACVCSQVIIGGGRKYMTPTGTKDPEYPKDLSSWGKRRDKRNLIEEWQSLKAGKVTSI